MTFTSSHTATANALRDVARTVPGMRPGDLRVLMAIRDQQRGVNVHANDVDAAILTSGARRATTRLRAAGLLTAIASDGTRHTKSGVASLYTVTDAGRDVASRINRACNETLIRQRGGH